MLLIFNLSGICLTSTQENSNNFAYLLGMSVLNKVCYANGSIRHIFPKFCSIPISKSLRTCTRCTFEHDREPVAINKNLFLNEQYRSNFQGMQGQKPGIKINYVK